MAMLPIQLLINQFVQDGQSGGGLARSDSAKGQSQADKRTSMAPDSYPSDHLSDRAVFGENRWDDDAFRLKQARRDLGNFFQ